MQRMQRISLVAALSSFPGSQGHADLSKPVAFVSEPVIHFSGMKSWDEATTSSIQLGAETYINGMKPLYIENRAVWRITSKTLAV